MTTIDGSKQLKDNFLSKRSAPKICFVLAAIFFIASVATPFFTVDVDPTKPGANDPYLGNEKSICGLASTPDTECATSLWKTFTTFEYAPPTLCGTPDAMKDILGKNWWLRRVDPEKTKLYCNDWQNERARLKVYGFRFYFFGWFDLAIGNLWAWLGFALAALGVGFSSIGQPKTSLLLTTLSLPLSCLLLTPAWWTSWGGPSGSLHPVNGVAVGFYLWITTLLLILTGTLIRFSKRT